MYKPRIEVVFGNERIISPSGLNIVGAMLGKSDFKKRCDRRKVDPKRSQPQIKDGDILLTYIGLLTLGKTAYDSVHEFDDDPDYFQNALGIAREMMNRGKSVPGGACGFWGACGAGISSGMFVSIISKSTPFSVEPFSLSHKMTAKSLSAIGEIGGPRCCKRDSYLSILSAVDFVKENFGVEMEKQEIVCTHSAQNNQCIGKKCPFAKVNHRGAI